MKSLLTNFFRKPTVENAVIPNVLCVWMPNSIKCNSWVLYGQLWTVFDTVLANGIPDIVTLYILYQLTHNDMRADKYTCRLPCSQRVFILLLLAHNRVSSVQTYIGHRLWPLMLLQSSLRCGLQLLGLITTESIFSCRLWFGLCTFLLVSQSVFQVGIGFQHFIDFYKVCSVFIISFFLNITIGIRFPFTSGCISQVVGKQQTTRNSSSANVFFNWNSAEPETFSDGSTSRKCGFLQRCNESTFSRIQVLHVSSRVQVLLDRTGVWVQQVSSLSPGVCGSSSIPSPKSGNLLVLLLRFFPINNIIIHLLVVRLC